MLEAPFEPLAKRHLEAVLGPVQNGVGNISAGRVSEDPLGGQTPDLKV